MYNLNKRKIWLGLIIFSVVFCLGCFVFTYLSDEGHRKISGNGGKEFVSQDIANKTFQEALTALSLGDFRTSASKARPSYHFGYRPGVLGSKSTWWTLIPGHITDTYDSILLSKSTSDSINNGLQNTGWRVGLHNNETSFDLIRALESERTSREAEIQKLQQSALNPNCIKSDSCQQTIESELHDLNDKPLSISYKYTKVPYWLNVTYSSTGNFEFIDIRINLTYSCTTDPYCSSL